MGYKMTPDTQVHGLFKRQTANGEKWVVSERVKGGNPTKVTLGYCSNIQVKKARAIAKQHLADMAQGINPNKKRQLDNFKGITLEEAIEQYLLEKGNNLKPSKIEAVFSNIIGLKKDSSLDQAKGCGFSIVFDKNRSLHNELTEARTVQYDLKEKRWIEMESSEAQIDTIIKKLESLMYINQKELAEALGKSEPWVSRWINRAIVKERLSKQKLEQYFQIVKDEREDYTSLGVPENDF